MRKRSKLFYCRILVFSLLFGCSSLEKKNRVENLSYARQVSLEIGSTMPKARDLVGEPTNKENVEDKYGKAIVWNYGLEDEEKLVLRFDYDSQKLISRIYSPHDSEPEKDLDYVLKKYPDYKFTRVSPACSAHYFPYEQMLIDSKNGMIVHYVHATKKVRSIVVSVTEFAEDLVKEGEKCPHWKSVK